MNFLRIVLVHPSHPSNIGSVARAMKTMGFSQLYLVAPKRLPNENAEATASGAVDVLQNAIIVDTLKQALFSCQLVIATSARERTLDWPQLSPRQAGALLVERGKQAHVAVVFGCERSGLSNSQLQQANFHLKIPANPDYSSLNLAMAVQIVCYEARMAWLSQENYADHEPLSKNYPENQHIDLFYEHLQQLLQQSGFLRAKHPGQIMNKIRRLFNRAHIEQEELHILRGILTALERLNQQRNT